jgi:hypothetical protein
MSTHMERMRINRLLERHLDSKRFKHLAAVCISCLVALTSVNLGCSGPGFYPDFDKKVGESYWLTVTIRNPRNRDASRKLTIKFQKHDFLHSYGVKHGKLYVLTGPRSARLLGDYREETDILKLGDRNLAIRRIQWGDRETHYYIAGRKHVMGKNARHVVFNGDIFLFDDDSRRGVRINAEGAVIGKISKKVLTEQPARGD